MTYLWLLFLHSWLRWLVLSAGAALLVAGLGQAMAGRAYGALEGKLSRVFIGLFDLQVLLGVLLYVWFSPITTGIRQHPGPWMKDDTLRFWGMEHAASAILALVAAHVGSVFAKKASSPSRARAWSLGSSALALLLILAAIPWPFLAYGRPLFRAAP